MSRDAGASRLLYEYIERCARIYGRIGSGLQLAVPALKLSDRLIGILYILLQLPLLALEGADLYLVLPHLLALALLGGLLCTSGCLLHVLSAFDGRI